MMICDDLKCFERWVRCLKDIRLAAILVDVVVPDPESQLGISGVEFA